MKSGYAAIIGRSNSGKSTLLNSLIGHKISIVSDKPQTTRHRILGIHTGSQGQIVFVDTPGIHKPGYRMNQRMLQTLQDSLDSVDLSLLMVDVSIRSGAGERFVLEMVKKSRLRCLLLLNKIDKIPKPALLPIMQRYGCEYDFLEIVPISALTGESLSLLMDLVFKHLPDGERIYEPELFTDRNERFLSSELIREKILNRTREEIPYVTAVLLRTFDESKREERNLVRLEADIIVEKRSQQGIIVGKGGSSLKNIGIDARKDIEHLLGCKVYLGLRVRTLADWRNNDSILDQLELG